MGRTQKRLTVALWGLVLVALVGVVAGKLLLAGRHGAFNPPGHELAALSAGGQGDGPPREWFAPPELKLIDQDDHAFSTAHLHGHPWIADFIFTTCGSLCPIMSHQMARLQDQTPPGVHLVSFTVDPGHDVPAVLKAYGQSLHADFARWHFLTGTHRQMADAEYAMKIAVEPAGPNTPIVHSDKFLLVNAEGKVVGIYDGIDARDVKRLAVDAAKLAGARGGAGQGTLR